MARILDILIRGTTRLIYYKQTSSLITTKKNIVEVNGGGLYPTLNECGSNTETRRPMGCPPRSFNIRNIEVKLD